jgi:hypothetical protein
LRHTQQFVALFPDPSGNTDVRAQFYTTGQNLEMKELYKQTDGYSSSKYRNLTHDGKPAPDADPNGNWADIDFPIFRLGEIYLTYAEAVLRNGTGGSTTQALTYINALRKRAWDNKTGSDITAAQLTLNFILDERGRELYYEAQRRTDLVRFDKYTTDAYIWAWKGGSAAGKSVDAKYNVFPIPSIDLTSNPHLVQNTGY